MVNKFFNCFLLGVILILLIYIVLQRENFQELIVDKVDKVEKVEKINDTKEDKEDKEDEEDDSTDDEIEYIKSVKDEGTDEKYYDYNYNYIVNNPSKKLVKVKVRNPIKVNNNNNNNNRDLAQVLSNTVGTPINQVYTPYSVVDKNSKKYKDWDRYFFPGYSYFPPSKWHIPVDNKYKFPPGYYKETNVCPLSVNNVWSEFLSGDEVGKQMEELRKSN